MIQNITVEEVAMECNKNFNESKKTKEIPCSNCPFKEECWHIKEKTGHMPYMIYECANLMQRLVEAL